MYWIVLVKTGSRHLDLDIRPARPFVTSWPATLELDLNSFQKSTGQYHTRFLLEDTLLSLYPNKQGKQCFQRCTRCYGNHHGNYHDNHSNHHGNYHAEQLLFSCQCSKVSSCRVVRLSSLIPWDSGHANKFLFLCSNLLSSLASAGSPMFSSVDVDDCEEDFDKLTTSLVDK